jgi:hypothetical protein
MHATDEQSEKAPGQIKRTVGGKKSDVSWDLATGIFIIDCNSLPNSKTRYSNSLGQI